MNIEAILDKIAADGRSDAERTLDVARQKAEATQKAFDEQADVLRQNALDAARQEAAALRDRMHRMAQLEARKQLLALKRVEIDLALDEALQKMRGMPQEAARAFHQRVLVANAQGNERLIIAQEDAALFDDAFMARVNQALKEAGKPGSLSVSDQRRPIQGGFVLSQGGMEVNCSYASMLRGARDQMEGEIAAILFPA